MTRSVFALAVALAALTFGAAQASAPNVASVEVAIGPDLAGQADKLGARELDHLSRDLRRTVERQLARDGLLGQDGGQLRLVIDDAVPSRPTAQQLLSRPGLSMESFGLGGARISGEYVGADGVRTPIRYSWYETDIRLAAGNVTWSDANTAFARLARRIGDGAFTRQ